MEVKELQVGKIYKIAHQRKGHFVAQLIEVEDGDERDPLILVVKYDVRFGTDQAHMAIEQGEQNVRVSGLRPSLIIQMEETEEQQWLREVKTIEEKESEPEKARFIDRILGRSN